MCPMISKNFVENKLLLHQWPLRKVIIDLGSNILLTFWCSVCPLVYYCPLSLKQRVITGLWYYARLPYSFFSRTLITCFQLIAFDASIFTLICPLGGGLSICPLWVCLHYVHSIYMWTNLNVHLWTRLMIFLQTENSLPKDKIYSFLSTIATKQTLSLIILFQHQLFHSLLHLLDGLNYPP